MSCGFVVCNIEWVRGEGRGKGKYAAFRFCSNDRVKIVGGAIYTSLIRGDLCHENRLNQYYFIANLFYASFKATVRS